MPAAPLASDEGRHPSSSAAIGRSSEVGPFEPLRSHSVPTRAQ
jgi:hypothetical protein